MGMFDKHNIRAVARYFLTTTLAFSLIYGCATAPKPVDSVVSGDAVLLDYTCRIEDGSILATTRKDDITGESAQLSHAFVPFKAYGPTPVKVKDDIVSKSKPVVHALRDEIVFRIIPQLPGLSYGEAHPLTLSSEPIENLPKMERYLQYARTLRRPKQKTIRKEQFVRNTGEEPKLEAVLFEDEPMQWKVLDIQEDNVTVEYIAEDGKEIVLPFGEAIVHDQGDHYDLEILGRPGTLVRVGPYIGRISDIKENVFIADFEHPFGGRKLSCEVTVNRPQESLEKVLESASVSEGKQIKSE